MSNSSSPGDLARIYCTQCGQVVFFTVKGGPMTVPCPNCNHVVKFEVVHDGRKWRVKDTEPGGCVPETC